MVTQFMGIQFIDIWWLLFGMVVGIGIGYAITTIRINHYLRTYYPEVNFQQTPKERKRILAERENKKDESTDEIVDDYLSQTKKSK